MALLDGGLQRIFGTALGGVYLRGTLIREDRIEDEDGGFQKYLRTKGVRYQFDTVTEAMRNAGYTERDARVLILQLDQHGCALERPTSDAQLLAQGVYWALSEIEGDPGSTHWAARATPA